jgi:hypothetical protein
MTTTIDVTFALLDAARSDGWLRTDVRRSFSDEELLEGEILSSTLLVESVFEAWYELPTRQLLAAVDEVMRHRPPEHPPLIEGEALRVAEILIGRRKTRSLLTLEMILAVLNAVHAAEGLAEMEIRTRLERSAQEVEAARPEYPAVLPPSTSARRSPMTPRSIEVVPDAAASLVDLGRLRLPLLPGMTLDADGQDPADMANVAVDLENDGVRLEVFTGDDFIDWDQIRPVLKNEFTEAGREVRERLGIFGVQLQSYIPVPDGFHWLRIIGHSEPSWTFRALITGAATRTPIGTPEVRRLYFGTLVDASAPTLHVPGAVEHRALVQPTTGEVHRIID